MKLLKKIFALVLVAIVAVSCSKDDASEPQTHTNLLLKTLDSDDGLMSTYTYDSSNRLSNYKLNGNASNAPRDYNFAYNADGTLNVVTEATGGAIVVKCFYDADKKVIRKEGRNGIDIYTYTYSGSVVTENYTFTINNSGFRQLYTYDGNGNITEIKSYTTTAADPVGTYSGNVLYTYDNKNNSNSSIPAAYRFPTSVNNIKTYQYSGGGIGSSTYEYNSDNYPVKRIDSYTRTYEYRQL